MSIIKVNEIQKRTGSTLTLGGACTAVTLASGATQTGFGRTGTVDWCTTAKTAPLTIENGKGYFINTAGGAITVTLPASPSAGDIVALKDYANTWDNNNVTLGNNSSKINGVCGNVTLSTEDQSITLVYVDATKGWRVVHDSTSDVSGSAFIAATGGTETTSGDFKIHTFTGDGTFTVTSGGGALAKADYLVVAGGGGGGAGHGAGGGAGGFRESHLAATSGCYTASPLASSTSLSLVQQAYPISVGGGGAAAGPADPSANTVGGNSTFDTITSTGGGKGSTESLTNTANAGGSGGGGTYSPNPGTTPGGAGNTPPVAPPQGNNGGDGGTYGPGAAASGGGGGASAVGANGTPSTSGAGGAGVSTAINPATGETGPGPAQYYAGGGAGGATNYGAPSPASGGVGGGGDGQPLSANPGPSNKGTDNTGGGGGGGTGGAPASYNGKGSTGGSGIVIIRYKFQ